MTLGGLAAAVGLVIDDAIVVVENIVLHRDLGQTRLQAIQSALKEITIPLIGSTITPVVVFIPLVVITGVTGVFFRALAVTMTVSLLTSLALAVTWTPTLSQYFIKGRQTRRKARSEPETALPRSAGESGDPAEDPQRDARLLAAEEKHLSGFFLRVVNFHERWLRRALERPWLLVDLQCCRSSWLRMLVTHFSGSDLLPEMDEGGFVSTTSCPRAVRWRKRTGSIEHVEQMLREIPEVESTSRRTGLQLGLAAVTEANTGDILVKLKAKRGRDIEEIMADVRADIKRAGARARHRVHAGSAGHDRRPDFGARSRFRSSCFRRIPSCLRSGRRRWRMPSGRSTASWTC